jgi:hypothetical protein
VIDKVKGIWGSTMSFQMQTVYTIAFTALLSACATQKIVRPDPPTSQPWAINPSTPLKHVSGKKNPSTADASSSSEAPANQPSSVSSSVTSIDRDVVNGVAVEVRKAIPVASSPSGWIEVEDLLNPWQRFQLSTDRLLVSPAYAVKTDVAEHTWTSSDAKKFAGKNKQAQGYFAEIESFRVNKAASAQNETMSLDLKLRNGKILSGSVDSNWKRTCDFFDQSVPSQGKGTFAVEGQTKNAKVLHPFEGKVCSEKGLAEFKFFNFDIGSSQADTEIPSAVIIVSSDRKKGINQVYFRHDSAKPERDIHLALASAFAKNP